LLHRANQLPAHISLDIHIVAIAAADLNQHRRLKLEPALVVVLDAIAVFPWRKLSRAAASG
jgi:hypothetical protein